METKTKTILIVMNVIAWITFVGLCIKTGAIVFSFFMSMIINPESSFKLYMDLNLSSLRDFSIRHYFGIVSFIAVISGLKAYLFYLVIQIFSRINLIHPFSKEISKLISRISYIALDIGILIIVAGGYTSRLSHKGVDFPALHDHLSGGGEFLLLAGVIFMIAQVFKKGIELQSENDLTI